MRIAQVVLTKTKSGKWKVTAQSLRQVEEWNASTNNDIIIAVIENLMTECEWETVSLD